MRSDSFLVANLIFEGDMLGGWSEILSSPGCFSAEEFKVNDETTD